MSNIRDMLFDAASVDLRPRQHDPSVVYEVVFGITPGYASEDPVLSKLVPTGKTDAKIVQRVPDFDSREVSDSGRRLEVWLFEFAPGGFSRFGPGKFEPLGAKRTQDYRAGYMIWRRRGGTLHWCPWSTAPGPTGPTAISTGRVDVRLHFNR